MNKKLFLFSFILILCGCSQYNPHKDFSYEDYLNFFEEENKTMGPVDVCAVGDSLTYHYDFAKYYEDITFANRGISGDTTTGLLAHLKESIYDVDCKIITLLIGINNLDTMMNDYEVILSNIKTNKPDIKTFVISLTPTRLDSHPNDLIVQRNKEIKILAEDYSFTYIDLHSQLIDSSGQLYKKYSLDGLHFSNAGYKAITSYIKPILKEALSN